LSGVSESYTFDSEPILAFYLGEEGGKVTRGLLERIQSGEAEGCMNVINLAEVYYILSRISPDLAEGKQKNLRSYGIRVVSVEDDGLWRDASRIKANNFLSLADAFAVATAQANKSKLVVGWDREFSKLGVQLLRIRE
jgi:predicted nucleic acid-binding protein